MYTHVTVKQTESVVENGIYSHDTLVFALQECHPTCFFVWIKFVIVFISFMLADEIESHKISSERVRLSLWLHGIYPFDDIYSYMEMSFTRKRPNKQKVCAYFSLLFVREVVVVVFFSF